MTDITQRSLPELFERLMGLPCLGDTEIFSTSDGLYLSAVSVADILVRRDITNVPNSRGCFWNAVRFLMTGISIQFLTTIFAHMACLK